jgi:hypothetical protein
MWIQSGDTITNKKNEILEVVAINGLYSSASNITIELKNLHTQENVVMNYMNEFYPQINSQELKPLDIKKKQSRGY